MELFLLPVFHAGLLGRELDGGEAQQPGLVARPGAGLRPGQRQASHQPLAQRASRDLRVVLSQRAAAGAADLRLQPAATDAGQRQGAVQSVLRRSVRPGTDRSGIHGRNPPWWLVVGGQRAARSRPCPGYWPAWHPAADRRAAGLSHRPADPDQRVRDHRQADLAGLGDLPQRAAAGRPAPLRAELPGAGNPRRRGGVLRADRQPVRLGPAVPGAPPRPWPAQAGHPRRCPGGQAAQRPATGGDRQRPGS